jgi:hypothetical protein
MENSAFTLILLLIALAATLSGLIISRRIRLPLRPIPAYMVLPETAADAVESANRLHFSIGSGALGDTSTVSALASAEVIYRLVERLAVSSQPPLITLSQGITLPLAQDTLRRAYEYRERMDKYQRSAAVWFPQGPRSLVFAAGASSLAADADVSSSILLGRFGTELALFGESALRHDQALIAHSDLPEGQAVAFVQADQVLLGEELYVGPAYIDQRPLNVGGVVAMDVLRWFVILGILVAALQAAL